MGFASYIDRGASVEITRELRMNIEYHFYFS